MGLGDCLNPSGAEAPLVLLAGFRGLKPPVSLRRTLCHSVGPTALELSLVSVPRASPWAGITARLWRLVLQTPSGRFWLDIEMMSGASLHDGFGQVARVVYVYAVFKGHEVGE